MKTRLLPVDQPDDKSLLDIWLNLKCRISGSMKGGIEGVVNDIPIIIKHIVLVDGVMEATWDIIGVDGFDEMKELLSTHDLGINTKIEFTLVKSHL